MKVLVTGASGYIGKRLIKALLDAGHEVVALVRDLSRFQVSYPVDNVRFVEGDLTAIDSLAAIDHDIDAAYFLAHSMSSCRHGFPELERVMAENFLQAMQERNISQIIYLSGIVNKKNTLSKHLSSRKKVEEMIHASSIPSTVLKAGLIIGAGSASFEIIRDLVEKLPVMVTPRWVSNKCALIAIADVLFYLIAVLGDERCFDGRYEIASKDVLTYKEIMKGYCRARGLKRGILVLPVLTVKLSSYWLYFVTSVNYSLASSLVNSLKVEVVREDFAIDSIHPHKCLTYNEALEIAFQRIAQNEVVSSWSEAISTSKLSAELSQYSEPPMEGVVFLSAEKPIIHDRSKVIQKLWRIGGKVGWYYMTFLWRFRGFLDKCVGGVGLSRGRRNINTIAVGDVIDFWRVLKCDKEVGELLLFAEMVLPGEAWLHINVEENTVRLKALFRPKGVFGRFYWYSLYPIHWQLFRGLANALASAE